MLRLVSGSSSTEVKFDQLEDLYILIPPGEDFDLFIDDIVRLREEIADIDQQLSEKRTKLKSRFLQLYESEKT